WPSSDMNTMIGVLLNRRYFEGLSQAIATQGKFDVLRPYRYALLASLQCTKRSKANTTSDWDQEITHYLPGNVTPAFPIPLSSFLENVRKSQQSKWTVSLLKRKAFQMITFQWMNGTTANWDPMPIEEEGRLAPEGEEMSASFQYLVNQLV